MWQQAGCGKITSGVYHRGWGLTDLVICSSQRQWKKNYTMCTGRFRLTDVLIHLDRLREGASNLCTCSMEGRTYDGKQEQEKERGRGGEGRRGGGAVLCLGFN